MLNKLKSTWWGVSILTIVYLYVLDMFFEYIFNRDVPTEIIMLLTLGVLVYTYHTVKLTHNFIYNNLKEKQND
jgi:uncharacterized membrane protein (DUF441 family)